MEFLGMSEGKGWESEKHNPSLGNCQKYRNRLGFVGK